MLPRFAALMILLVYAALPLSAQAQAAYRWVDKAGRVHYTDTPPPPAERPAPLHQRDSDDSWGHKWLWPSHR